MTSAPGCGQNLYRALVLFHGPNLACRPARSVPVAMLPPGGSYGWEVLLAEEDVVVDEELVRLGEPQREGLNERTR